MEALRCLASARSAEVGRGRVELEWGSRVQNFEVIDTTLRDGEQTPGISYTPEEKLVIAEALIKAGVDSIEVGSAGVSQGEGVAVRAITDWARANSIVEKIEVLGFVDGTRSPDWIVEHGEIGRASCRERV